MKPRIPLPKQRPFVKKSKKLYGKVDRRKNKQNDNKNQSIDAATKKNCDPRQAHDSANNKATSRRRPQRQHENHLTHPRPTISRDSTSQMPQA